jgi:hypothetical protein
MAECLTSDFKKIKKKSRASGLEGVLYIDKNNFAVSKDYANKRSS